MSDEAFYATAAQVIPVLWVILVVEFRLFGGAPKRGWVSMTADETHRRTPWPVALMLVIIGFLLWTTAEVNAIEALAQGEERDRRRIELAIILGALFVFLMPTQPRFEALLDRIPFMTALRMKIADWARHRKEERPESAPKEG